MRNKLKTFLITCDSCGHKEVVQSIMGFAYLPEGWGTEESHDCGLTNYSRAEDLCPICLQKIKRK